MTRPISESINLLETTLSDITTSLGNKEVTVEGLKASQVPDKIREIELAPKESVKLKAEFIGTGMESEIGTLSSCSNVTSVIFTDEKAPDDVTIYDKSANEDSSVVAWFKDSTLYISSQVKGARVEMYDCYYNTYTDYLGMLTYYGNGHKYQFSQLTEVDLKNIDTSKMTNMIYLFYSSNLQNIKNLDKLDTSNVENMGSMFCYSKITSLDLSSFDFSNIQTTKEMFLSCENLTEINIGSIEANKLTIMEGMFRNCTVLKNVDFSNVTISNLENIKQIFYGCTQLQKVIFGQNFKTDNITNMNGLFWNCNNLQEVDMSYFTIKGSDVITSSMFSGCLKLTTIYAQEWYNSGITSSNSSSMFNSCKLLPNFSKSYINIARAKWKENGGYFTNPAEKG